MNLNGWLFFVNLFVHWMTFLLYKRDFLTIICWKCTHPFTHTIALHEEVCTVLQLLLSYWSIKNLILRQPSSPETLPLRCPPLQPDQEGVWHWGTIFSPGRWNISWRPQIQCLIWRLSLTSGLIIPYQRERERVLPRALIHQPSKASQTSRTALTPAATSLLSDVEYLEESGYLTLWSMMRLSGEAASRKELWRFCHFYWSGVFCFSRVTRSRGNQKHDFN